MRKLHGLTWLPLCLGLFIWLTSCEQLPTASETSQPLVDSTVAPKIIPTEYAVGAPYPNPFSDSTTLRLDLPEATDAVVWVESPSGEHLRVLMAQHLEAGTHYVVWDGKNDDGHDVDNGFYFIWAATPRFQNWVLARRVS
jgi:flagellar hook assembly protein FlgD